MSTMSTRQPYHPRSRSLLGATRDPEDIVCPFFSWKHYLPLEDYSSSATLIERIGWSMEYFVRSKMDSQTHQIRFKQMGSFSLDYRILSQDAFLARVWPRFVEELYDDPEMTLSILCLAMHQVLLNKVKAQPIRSACLRPHGVIDSSSDIPYRLRARLSHYDKFVEFRHVRAGLYGKLVIIRGNVIRTGPIVALCRQLTFRCRTCLSEFSILQPDGIFSQPSRCPGNNTENRLQCTGSSFKVLRRSPKNVMVESQTVLVQEDSSNTIDSEVDRIPRSIQCKLTEDLVGQCFVGQTVAFTGIIKAENTTEEKHRMKKENNIFSYYFQVVSIYHQREASSFDDMLNDDDETELSESQHSSISSSSSSSVNSTSSVLSSFGGNSGPTSFQVFTHKDYGAIRDIYGQPQLFALLVASLCPSIYGHLLVKAGLLLSLFGGNSQGEHASKTSNPITRRSNIHLLMIGDPGIGKSHLLRNCANLSSRGVFVCGNSTTRSGLTISLVKDKENPNDYSLEAGALVLSDHGTCCLDEFDKMKKEHQCLLEAMEQQSVSLAKSGVVCSLPTRTSILAAANPHGGHYNRGKSLSENLKFSPALLSRFDLIFLLLDRPDTVRDKMLTEHVVEIRSNPSRGPPTLPSFVGIRSIYRNPCVGRPSFHSSHRRKQQQQTRKDLVSRLEECDQNNITLLSTCLLRKYIAYAREYVHPVLDEEAKLELKKFYLSLRSSRHSGYSTPVNPRQLESLVRLAEARAKTELRENVTRDDALDVIEIVKMSLNQVMEHEHQGPPNSNVFEADPLYPGSKRVKRSSATPSFQTEAKRFLEKLRLHVRETGDTHFHLRDLETLASVFGSCQNGNFDEIIEYINNLGYLIKKAGNVFQFQGK